MLEIIGIACIGVLWIYSEPTIRFRNWLLKSHDGIWRRLLECAMCSTFWIAVIYQLVFGSWSIQFDLLFAAMAAVLAELLCKKLLGGL
jgi:hypothetical protein